MLTMRETVTRFQVQRSGEFFKKLSPAALRDLESMEFPTLYQPGVLLFSEKATPAGIFIVTSGEVKLSINSSDGKRLILSIAKAGDVLASRRCCRALPSEMTAETLYPSRIAVIERDQFLTFMARHPESTRSLPRSLACSTRWPANSSARWHWLVRLRRSLRDSCWTGARTARRRRTGMRFRFSLTHEEIGEFIGASR